MEDLPSQIKTQVEYYLSDKNLQGDKFFHDTISGAFDGWLDMTLLMNCAKLKALTTDPG
jgi:hypothetical protein